MSQLDLFATPPPEPVANAANIFPDSTAWRAAQNTTPTRCDRCANWTRSGTNYWGECSARKSYEHEYGGKGCATFVGSVQPIDELGPFMQYMVTERPESDHGKAWRAGKRRVGGQWVAP